MTTPSSKETCHCFLNIRSCTLLSRISRSETVLQGWRRTENHQRKIRDLCIAIFAFVLPSSWYFLPGQPFVAGVLPIYGSPALFLTDIGLIALLAAVLIKPNKSNPRLPIPKPFLWPLLLILLFALVTVPFSVSPTLALYSALRWLLAGVVFLLVFHLDVPLRRFITILLISLCVQGSIAVFQAIAQRPLGLPGEMTLPIENHEAAVIYMTGRAWLRAYGLTFHPNVLGGYLLEAVILMLPWLKHRAVQAAWLLMLGGLFFSFSRSAWVATALTLPFLLGWMMYRIPDYSKRLMLLFAAGALGLALLLPLFSNQIASRLTPFGTLSERTSISGRGELMHIAIETIYRDPLTGAGAGNFPALMRSYPTLDRPHYVHNVNLLLSAEIGILGGLAWLWLWLFPMVRVNAFLNNQNPWPVILTGAWLAWGVIGLWDSYPWALESGRLFSVLLLALLARTFLLAKNDAS